MTYLLGIMMMGAIWGGSISAHDAVRFFFPFLFHFIVMLYLSLPLT